MATKSRTEILQNIFSHFQQMSQWVITSPKSYASYYSKAEALIEYLEVVDCGSVGGFDNKNKLIRQFNFELYDRFMTLMNKENTKLKPICGFTPTVLGFYFKEMGELRSKTLDKY